MREIKVRYTVTRDNGYVFSQVFTLAELENGDFEPWMKANNIWSKHLHRDVFTGLKDKNGMEIYEGDIVRWHDATLEVRWGSVGWVLAGLLFKRIGTPDGPCSEFNTKGYTITSEIVGNIYENPELLEATK